MDRLLTDKEIADAWPESPTTFIDMENPFTEEQLTILSEQVAYAAKVVAKVQDAKSIKVDRQAMAKWLGEFCNNGKHQTPASRLHCVFCMVDFYDAASEGKIPGEEK